MAQGLCGEIRSHLAAVQRRFVGALLQGTGCQVHRVRTESCRDGIRSCVCCSVRSKLWSEERSAVGALGSVTRGEESQAGVENREPQGSSRETRMARPLTSAKTLNAKPATRCTAIYNALFAMRL